MPIKEDVTHLVMDKMNLLPKSNFYNLDDARIYLNRLKKNIQPIDIIEDTDYYFTYTVNGVKNEVYIWKTIVR